MKVRHMVQEKLMLVREQTHLYERDLPASPDGVYSFLAILHPYLCFFYI